MSQKKTRKKSRASFGATAPPFIDYLKDILRRYPDGGQILKELIQNADDAKATKVVFIHDERSYGTESLWNDEMQKFQGPALYAYNDAAFTNEDWEGIQMAGRSVKRNDPTKVGRFGIGFNSVYHTTDVPGILSSGYLGLMDPQEKVFGERTGGIQWCLKDTEDQETLINLHDQFQPYRDMVLLVSKQDWSELVLEHQHFEGTLFRFPLRNEASEICTNLYDSDRVVELFDSFIADADLSLLFLKSVTSVSLMYIDVDGTVSTRLDVKCSVSKADTLQSEDWSIINSLTRFKQITINSEIQEESNWLVTTCTMKEGHVEELDVLSERLSYIPRVDLAFPCDQMRDCSQSRLSCFLPLPNNESNKTGFPVHINACFGLTDNRRNIKWKEEDQKHDEQALWNELLIKDVLPVANLIIIKDAITLAQLSLFPASSVYDLWPDIAQTQHKEKWYNVTLDVFHQLFKEHESILSLAKDETCFVTPSEAVFLCDGSVSKEILTVIKKTLINYGENLVTLPAHVEEAVEKAYPNLAILKRVTPSYIRNFFCNHAHAMERDDKRCLLEYVLSDENYKELNGLQLLPLSNGSFISFTNRAEDTALIDSKEFPRILLPFCGNLFIPEDLSTTCKTHLKKIGRKDLFKIINIDASHVAAYTKKFWPPNWNQSATGVVLWDIGNDQHPPLEWLQQFWRFLNTHFKDLGQFIGVPLIPVSPLSAHKPVLLAKLQHNTTLISLKSKQSKLPDHIVELVNSIGGTVVRGNEWLKHDNLGYYIMSPSPRSVLNVLMNLDSQHVIRELKTVSPKAREKLKDYLSGLGFLSNLEKNFLSKLPLFQTVNGFCVAAQSKQAVLSSNIQLPPKLPFPGSLVQCATEADRRLFQLLQIELIGVADAATFLIDMIEKKNCSNEDIEEIMTWILQHGNILFSQNKSLQLRCKDLRFIKINGELKKISNFFDPTVRRFNVIFVSELFPPTVYTATQQMLESLLALGLVNKEEDILPEHLLRAAISIEEKSVNFQMEARERAQILVQMLNSNNHLPKFSNKDLQHLRMIKWLPCDQLGDDKRLISDENQKRGFFCPDEMRHFTFEDIVGQVMPLVGKLSDTVSLQLGLKRPPPPEKVLENLSFLSLNAQNMAEADTDIDFKRKLHSIYKHMQENISTFALLLNRGMKWLWYFGHFVSPQDLVLEYPPNLDLNSYIGKVPCEYLPYKRLLLKCGLKTLHSDEEIFGILQSIQQTIEEKIPPFATSSEIKVSIDILNWSWRRRKTVPNDIPVPVITEDEHFTLKPQSKAVFCDLSKKVLKQLVCSQDEVYVLHEEIPKATAEWLNIRLLSTYILDPEQVGIEQCGQSEPITIRIKNILKEYDEESDIFKELIQNAEDATANTCKFLIDFRVHKDDPKTLIDPEMALCQGPCLWAFNNEQFTELDWENIVRVGAASKENKAEKIGKFGLGFNTVYHVTDIPFILSGKKLLILDPNVTHLKKHIKYNSNPGIKLDLSRQQHFHCFPGQFTPYEHIFDCHFTQHGPLEPYQGTLIKLPFRCEEEAMNSEISKKVYYKDDINAIQKQFQNDSQMHLIFLRNINTISLQSLSSNASTPPRDDEIETTFTVSKIYLSTKNPSKNCLTAQHQAQKSLMKVEGNYKEVIDSSALHIVQITSERSEKTDIKIWLLYNCIGTGQALNMALQKNKKAIFFLPIGGIAVPLQNNQETGKFSTLQKNLLGRAFCFLPLSIDTGLPVNVNGMFAVTSNRRGLWESGKKKEWNKALLQDPVVTAYLTTLLTLKEMAENNELENYCYHKFWPNRENVSNTFKPLVDAFYHSIAKSYIDQELLSDSEQWCSLKNSVFLHESIEKNKDIATLLVQVCKKSIKAPQCVVFLPSWLRNSFKQAGQGQVLEDRTWNWERIYTEVVLKNLNTIDAKTRDTLVLHAIDLQITELDSLLLRFPCIPTKDGKLQYIDQLVNPTGRVACLFGPKEGRLLGGTKNDFYSPKRIQRLLELGMANNHLSLEDITKKAHELTITWNVNKNRGYQQLKCLLELMKDHIHEKNSMHWETLRQTTFLPAFCPGGKKLKEVETLRKPVEIFSDKCELLVNLTCPVLDHNKLKIHNTDPILKMLGVRDNPKPELVLEQLLTANKQSEFIDGSMLHKIVVECYTFLDRWLTDSPDSTLISQFGKSFPFVLIGHKFVNVSHVAENEQFEAKPYLHVLPPAYGAFRNLWTCVGLEKMFTINQFLTVLQELHLQYEDKPLQDSDLSICLSVLNRGIYDAKKKIKTDCLIPNEHGVLQHASELCFNDSPWMPVISDVTLCHERIPRVVACHFGIRTTRHHTLDSQVNEEISPFSFEFKQQEELTVRIKNIISAYPSKKDILKELIQNADDAEATEIHFVWDKREHKKEKTFGKRWNHLQGPALCVFNNKVFTDADLQGIQQLGEGGKQNSPGKIGKYGVGFNSVYNLTDCPSILTGDEKLCISDPNKKYIESHSDKPRAGIGYNLSDDLKEMYKDVYNSYLPDLFPLKEGTMFRLPLRMGTNANSSNISQQGVTENDMKDLTVALSEDPEGLILFLKNISKIKFHIIRDKTDKLETMFTVEKQLTENNKEIKMAFRERLQNALISEKTATPHKAFYKAVINTSDQKESVWLVGEQFGSFKDSHGIKTLDKLPQAALAARVSAKNLLPNTCYLDFIGEAFCSLPLPGKTGLPVHVNGNFEVDFARRDLWKQDGQSVKANWNKALKEDVIAHLYADLLYVIRRSNNFKKVPLSYVETCLDTNYLCFWPVVSKFVGKDWHEMINEVYKAIKDKKLDVIPVIQTSVRTVARTELKECSFNWCFIDGTKTTEAPQLTDSIYDEINPILEDLGVKLVPNSQRMSNIWNSFKSAGVDVKLVSPTSVLTFLKAKLLNDPNKTDEGLPLPITDTLIRDKQRCSVLLTFCLTNLKKENYILLNGLPLLLTTDNVLRVFNSESPKMMTRYESLFFYHQDHFAHFQTNKSHRDVLEASNLVTHLTVPHAVPYLKPLVQHLLQFCNVDQSVGLHVPHENIQKWLKSLWMFLASEVNTAIQLKDEKCLEWPDVRKLLSDFCVLPVVCPKLNNRHFLQKMSAMSSVVQFASDDDLSSILFKLGFMKLDTAFFSEITLKHFPLHPELLDVKNKNSVLDQVCTIRQSEFLQLTREELKELQEFLQSGVSKAKGDDYQIKLKSLPIFETVNRQRIRIDGPKKVFVLNCENSATFPDLFTLPNSNSVFLQNNSENIVLAETLKIEILSDLDYFMKFLLPVMHTLTENQILQCLQMLLLLKKQLKYHKFQEHIILSLTTMRLIKDSQGKMEVASYFFDEEVTLFRLMVPKVKFVPESFWMQFKRGGELMVDEAKSLIRKLGMKHCVSEDHIRSFAYQIQSEAQANAVVTELKMKSKLVFQAALNKESEDKNNGGKLLESLADIKFIFPVKIKKELCNYNQPFASEISTVKIRGSLIESDPQHQELIWSSMPIVHVPVCMSKKLKEILSNVEFHKKPPTHCVTRNLKNVCQLPCKTEELLITRSRVFRNSFAYLQATGFDKGQLAGLPLILVEKDTALIKVDLVSLSLDFENEFRPYLYKISPEDVRYANFFEKIGVTNEATVGQYCNVLAAVHVESQLKPQLNPNQMKTVKRAVQQLFKLIKGEENASLNDVQQLYLPAVDGKLYPSSTLYCNDTAFEARRLEEAVKDSILLMEKLSECHLEMDIFEQLHLLQMLPTKLQPKMLSKSTEEKTVESPMELCEFGTGCEFRQLFEGHLSSTAFRHGLVCIIRQRSQGKITQDEAAHMCEKTFGCIQIVCCKTLKTVLWLEHNELPQSAKETDVCVKKEEQGCVFYLKHNDVSVLKVLNEVNQTLAKVINALLGYKMANQDLMLICQLLLCDNLEDVQRTLAKYDILDSAESASSFFKPPNPGTEIPVEWHDSLDMDILNNFKEGEFVGYWTDKFFYAIIVEELPGALGLFSRKYKIDLGRDEPIEVGCLDLYQFKQIPKLIPTGTKASGMELELFAGAVPHTSQRSARQLPASVEEAKREIDKCLAEIWILPENERLNAIKRLYLRWHPDKNLDSEFVATEAFKYLKNRIEELTSGKSKTQSTGSSYHGRYSQYGHFYQQWNEEARHHRRGREQFFRNYHSYNFWSFNRNVPRPNKEEARRWYRQASCDLVAAHMESGKGTPEWCLFKVHQAVEKALIAAEFKRKGQQSRNSSISAIAEQVSCFNPQLGDLLEKVQVLTLLGVDGKKTQYPNSHPYPHIPHDQFNPENEALVLSKATEVLETLEMYIHK